ncbi:hypothetical protein OsI_34063 [Oryza sativa Indica Group]|uniref:DUF4220 domain-containing protein n=1 Tax=Oryza sativa subsp. indica TaxID=39946 RepID=B8BHI7_ORYSI|nr:hypothetical protein OsI_34063 [Oryza sativa Indica Group]
MKLTFMVVLMALMGSIIYSTGFLRLSFRRLPTCGGMFLYRYDLTRIVRFVLNFVFFQFVPLLSSAFSQSENRSKTELLLILLWMLLAEIIRKKVQGMLLPTDGSSFNRGIGRFTLMDYAYDTLLVLSAVNRWFASYSFHTARNPLVIAGYMTKVMDKYNRDGDGRSAVPANDMSNCKFVVMGRRVVVAGGGHQHQATYCNENEQKHLHLCIAEPDDYSNSDSNKEWPLVTVKTIWEMREKHKNIFHGKIGDFLEDLCLSFSLFKMLRRQFEHYPMVEVGSDMARAMMLDGLLKLNFSSPGSNSSHDQLQRPFQVLLMELELLKNYYQQAAAPVVMSQPILFCTNFLSSIIFLYFFIDAVVDILIVNKDAAPLYCRIMGWGRTPVNSPSLILSLTMLLVLTVILIEAHDFLTSFVFSDWNIVRMLCSYDRPSRRWLQKIYSVVIYIRSCLLSSSKNKMTICQVSILDACGPIDKHFARTSQVTLPASATAQIIQALCSCHIINRSTGAINLPSGIDSNQMTTTEAILAWHLATELLETTTTMDKQKKECQIASVLSKRCGCRACPPSRRCRKKKIAKTAISGDQWENSFQDPTVRRGVKLFHWLREKPADEAWDELARLWVHLVIYLAPSNDVQGHAKALASWGADLITCLWALCTHAGITRQPPPEQHDVLVHDEQQIDVVVAHRQPTLNRDDDNSIITYICSSDEIQAYISKAY